MYKNTKDILFYFQTFRFTLSVTKWYTLPPHLRSAILVITQYKFFYELLFGAWDTPSLLAIDFHSIRAVPFQEFLTSPVFIRRELISYTPLPNLCGSCTSCRCSLTCSSLFFARFFLSFFILISAFLFCIFKRSSLTWFGLFEINFRVFDTATWTRSVVAQPSSKRAVVL